MNKELEGKVLQYAKETDSIMYPESFIHGARFMFNKLTWKPIDPDNLPKVFVLCKYNGGYIIGRIIMYDRFICCSSVDRVEPVRVTHYIDLKNFE